MNSDDLIKNLAKDLKPVNSQSTPKSFAIKYLLISLLVAIVAIVFLQLRADLYQNIMTFRFLTDLALNFFVLLSGILLTAWLSTAGRNYNQNYKFLVLFLFLTILGFNAYRLSLTPFFFKSFFLHVFDIKCFTIVMLISLFSTGIVTIAVSKRIVFNGGLVGAIIGFLSFSIGSFVISFHCPMTAEEHVTLYHTILPMISGSIVGFVAGKIFLK